MVARLTQHRTLGSAPAHELAWLAAHGRLLKYDKGVVASRKGEPAQDLLICLTGHVVIRMDRGAGAHKIFEWRGGDVGGTLPYSRGAAAPADAVAEEDTEYVAVSKDTFPELIRECPVVTAKLVHVMIDRARAFTSGDLRDEKLRSLGKLASGLAHELNNPASAVVRSAKHLYAAINASEVAARRLGAAALTDAQIASIDEVRGMCATPAPDALSAIARADREDAIAEWLDKHGASATCADPLAQTSVTLTALDKLAATVRADALDAALRWLAAGCQVRSLCAEIETAGSRISDLVGTIKGFSYMDRAPASEAVDIRRGITDALRLLGHKIREKSVTVELNLADDLPPAHGIGGELNQVWMNLLDNAVDAVAEGGTITVSAARERDWVTVHVIDNGSGIPQDIQGRIFDPFFTTKAIGKGTGLGLDIVRRLVQSHTGEISLDSIPGRTEFEVRLRPSPKTDGSG